MTNRTYLPYQSARDYRDRGMMKWMGFYLSEHTTSLTEDRNKIDLSSELTRTEKFTLIGQLYASQIKGKFIVKSGKNKEIFIGDVREISSREITIKTANHYKLIKVEDILVIKMAEENYLESERNL
ncbi:hypothetical protein SAMN02910293_01335 [Streptococcus henryi]|uniref:YolD-like protein n=1 Tax=Streptococcus henryi TaxID=439219 RepID=A0A1G6C1M1_9STRE|nr:hypothetical protein [Streptococcus henryi]SDB26779.1 hypothetical protein SAMN02910293_01335 [Streptococcus henryi]